MIYSWYVHCNGVYIVRNSFTPDVRSFAREKHALEYMRRLKVWL